MTTAFEIMDVSHIAPARRQAAAAAAQAGFDEVRCGQVALAVTELATNLVRHGGGGQLLLQLRDHGLDLLALDRGPGMADVAACMVDGYSTAGSLGHGLGALRRLSPGLEIASWPGRGTALLVRLDRQAGAGDDGLAALALPKPGEPVCGDAWSRHDDTQGRTLLLVDGLGHGSEAALAANAAVRQFQRHPVASPQALVEAIHQAMRATRGGAVAVARLDWDSGVIGFAGLGNIAALCVAGDGQVRRMVSLSGTAGHNARRVQAFDYPCSDGVLVMCSDGLRTHWSLADYPGLARAHPLLIAGVLLRDHLRGHDDASVLVSRTRRP